MLLAASVALAGCAAETGFGGEAPSGPVLSLAPGSAPAPAAAAPSGRVPGSPALDIRDTGGTPEGAAAAAQAAIGAGAGLLLGPLTSAETAAASGPAQSAGVAMLAFTNDPTVAKQGVWTLGITPQQQVARLVEAAKGEGRQRFAALLPDSPFGQALGKALADACQAAGLAAPDLRTQAASMTDLAAQIRELAGYANRRGPIDAQIRELRARRPKGWYEDVQKLLRSPIPPPPIDALLLGAVGDSLVEIASLLPYYDLDTSIIRVMGPSLWADPQQRAGARVGGAWYAAPDPAARADFVSRATADGSPAPPSIADLAYDAASIARVVSAEGGFSRDSLERPGGFGGSDGVFQLMPDGSVRRALAVFAIAPGGADTIAAPAPASLTGSAI